jgi:serine-type D-Ala-D-Ala carboxypeptidase/endopeptidase (penicillin-binding protein 4)
MKVVEINFFFIIFFLIGFPVWADDIDEKSYQETYFIDITKEDSLRSVEFLQKEISGVLNNATLNSAKYAVAVYSIEQKRYLFNHNINALLTPASNTKLVSTFAVLTKYGRDYEVTTEIFTDDTDLTDGIVNGNVYILGFGDAYLSTQDVEELADDIRKLGISKITGNIIADGTFMDNDNNRFSYSNDRDEVVPLSPITALTIEKNQVTIIVSSGGTKGRNVNVSIVPASEYFNVSNTATVRTASLDEPNLRFQDMGGIMNDFVYYYYGDQIDIAQGRRSSVRIGSNTNSDKSKQNLTITGWLRPNRTVSYRHHIQNPDLALAGHLKNRLQSGGVEVQGNIELVSDTLKPNYLNMFMLTFKSRSINNFINDANKQSDNFIAEYLFRMLGGKAPKGKTTAEHAKANIEKSFIDYSIPCSGCMINDGSGLSRRNLVTAESMIEILKRAYEMNLHEEFLQTLAIAGKDGTLHKRMNKTAAEEKVYAKTGTLRNVSALSGIVKTIDGETLLFSFIFNGNNVGSYKDIENRLAVILAQFFYFHEVN